MLGNVQAVNTPPSEGYRTGLAPEHRMAVGREGDKNTPRSTLFEADGAGERGKGSVNIGWRASQANLFLFLGRGALARDGRAGGLRQEQEVGARSEWTEQACPPASTT